MGRSEVQGASPVVGATVGILATALFVAALLFLMSTNTYGSWSALLVTPLLIGAALPAISRQARREDSRALFWLLVVALCLKLAGALVRYFIAFDVYEGSADAAKYHRVGVELSERFRGGEFSTGLDEIIGTEFIEFATGVLYTLIGPTRLGGFLVYSWLGFMGLFFFYRAYREGVPEGRAHGYARLLFFLPSLLFWPSSIGKEAWMMFALGVVALGAARMLSGAMWKGLPIAVAGLWLTGLARPHVAGLMGLALAGAFLVKKPREHLQQLAPVAKVIGLVAVSALALMLVIRTEAFIKDSPVGDTGTGVGDVLDRTSERTSQGGSQFRTSILQNPAAAPMAAVTVLFRPLVIDAHNAQALVAAIEGTFLLAFALVRWRWAVTALKSIRRQPYIAFALAYIALFVFAFSSVGNFGILTRQRVQVLPLFLAALTIPPLNKREEEPDEEPQLVAARR